MSKKEKKMTQNENGKAPETSSKKIKKPRTNRLLSYLLIVCIAGVIGGIIACIRFFGPDKIKRNAAVNIEFTYDGAAKNLTPSGEKFSINAILGEDVIKAALERAGMSERYTVEAIKDSLVVSGSYPGDIINKIKDYDSLYNFSESRSVSIDDYYPTIYTISLYDDFDSNVSKADLNNLVKAIADQFKEYFTGEYIYAFDMQTIDNLMVLDKYDYSQRVKILKLRLQLVEKYSLEMYNLDTNFRQNGKSFNDVMLKCKEIENDSLNKAEASIMMDVLTVSSVRLRNQYEYEKKLLENEKMYKQANLDEINKLIEEYQVDSILYIPAAGDAFVKVDSNSKETYETLIDKKREISDRIVEIDSEISRFDLYLQDIKKVTYSSSSKNKKIAEELDNINQKVIEQENAFKSMSTAYNNTIISEDSVMIDNQKYYDSNILSGSFAIELIKCAGPICVLALILCCLHSALFEIKALKKKCDDNVSA
ncbi:MAG: hypothetical protein IKP88_21100 [Lachnospiraceae bacterium]|nr:hypothetical protein [Lachnospiraceae bacterium]